MPSRQLGNEQHGKPGTPRREIPPTLTRRDYAGTIPIHHSPFSLLRSHARWPCEFINGAQLLIHPFSTGSVTNHRFLSKMSRNARRLKSSSFSAELAAGPSTARRRWSS